MKAIWNDVIIAESDMTIQIEGNYYFPPDSIKKEFFHESNSTTRCIWKGKANYFSVTVNDKINPDCAWFYPKPSFLAKKITGYVAFWKGVQISN
ncbi:MAG TPA: DUF427 domain-containing protein [Nitrosopumilaceae archaeon]|jgi:uncharacterized protein (DUF427 family)|nr:DUF427 domain-containing protein [Nitrosopumilaceae archaeon]